MTTEAQIHADIEAIREKIPETQDIYRGVCTILFFRYGITPTANKLYQYVRKGSMSAPAEALAKFWEDLREKSRVRIEHPDLPDVLKTAAGDLVSILWVQAQKSAQEGLAAFRSEALAAIQEAQTAKSLAESSSANLQTELELVRQSTQVTEDRALQLERELAAERASKELLSTQLVAAGHQQLVLESAIAEARRDFASELEKLRQALQGSEERCDATEKRALLEIDRERTSAAKLQKELAQLRQIQLETAERHRGEIAELQKELGMARQSVGVAEGTLQVMRVGHQQQTDQLQSLQTALSERETQNALLLRDLNACQEARTILEHELQQASAIAFTPRKRSRKIADA